MAPDDLAFRVAQIEEKLQELRHGSSPAGLAYGLSLVRDEVAELRTEMRAGFAAVDARFDEIDTRFGDVNSRLDDLAAGVAQILERLGGGGQSVE